MRCSTLCRIGLFNSFYCFLSRKQAPNFIVVFGPVALRKTLNIYLYSSFLDFLSIHLTNLKAFEHGRCLLCPILLCNVIHQKLEICFWGALHYPAGKGLEGWFTEWKSKCHNLSVLFWFFFTTLANDILKKTNNPKHSFDFDLTPHNNFFKIIYILSNNCMHSSKWDVSTQWWWQHHRFGGCGGEHLARKYFFGFH